MFLACRLLETYKIENIMKKKIGYIGLGKMGKSMVTRLLENGWEVVAFNRTPEAVVEVSEKGAQGVASLKNLVEELAHPRLIWIMVSHDAVDDMLSKLLPRLFAGDVIIDGGNSNFKDTVRRSKELAEKGIKFMDVGVSGGPSGALRGACTMIGGSKEVFNEYMELFRDISAPRAFGYMGSSGSGHFVKMIHNGIEYGMMQAIGEGFEVMKKSPQFNIDLMEVARVYNNKSVIESRLIEWLYDAYKQNGVGLSAVSGSVSHSGEGLWAVETAKETGVPVPIIEGSLKFREESQKKPSYTGKVVSALRNQFGGHDVGKR